MADYELTHYTREIDRFLYKYKYINIDDFWLFAKKYNDILKKVKSTSKKSK